MQLFHFECFHIALFRNQQSAKDPQPLSPRPGRATEAAPSSQSRPQRSSGSCRVVRSSESFLAWQGTLLPLGTCHRRMASLSIQVHGISLQEPQCHGPATSVCLSIPESFVGPITFPTSGRKTRLTSHRVLQRWARENWL